MIYKKIIIFLLVFILSALPRHLLAEGDFDNCPMNNGKIDVSEIANITTGADPLKTCHAPVSSFNMNVYQMAMCTSDPTDFIMGLSDNDPCFYLWNTDSGDDLISFGVTKSSEASFPSTLPPTGVYTHAFGTIGSTIDINIELEFDEQKIFAGNSEGTAWSGFPLFLNPQSFVGGGDRNMSMKDFAEANYYGFTEIFSESQSSFNNYSFTYNSFGLQEFLNRFSNTNPNHAGDYNHSFLLNNNNNVASSYSEVTKILVMTEYTTPKVVTDQTSSIIYKYSPDHAALVSFSPVGGGWIVTSILFGSAGFDTSFE